jgi:transposase
MMGPRREVDDREEILLEQIIAKLRGIEGLTAQGLTIPMAAKKAAVTDQTFYRWRTRYGALKGGEAMRLDLDTLQR